jgi:hypothetical protein
MRPGFFIAQYAFGEILSPSRRAGDEISNGLAPSGHTKSSRKGEGFSTGSA